MLVGALIYSMYRSDLQGIAVLMEQSGVESHPSIQNPFTACLGFWSGYFSEHAPPMFFGAVVRCLSWDPSWETPVG